MRHGITFRGKHSNDIGVIVKTVGRPFSPPVKQIDEEVQYRDGNIDLSETGGRLYFEDKVLELEFQMICPDNIALQRSASKLVNWLSGGYGELIFDDMPTVKWIAKPVDLDDMKIELYKNSKLLYNLGAGRLTTGCMTVRGYRWTATLFWTVIYP